MDERPPITAEEARRIARLAHLDLADDELAGLVVDLGRILEHVKQLEELDLEGVPPTAHGEIERLALREDEPHSSLPRDLALREAPRVSADGFAVPAFVDEG